MNMKRTLVIMLAFLASGLTAFAASLGTAARTVIPVEVQQIINVDYRRMKNSDTAMDMKAKLLPPNMKQFGLHVHGCVRIFHAPVIHVDNLLDLNGNYRSRGRTK